MGFESEFLLNAFKKYRGLLFIFLFFSLPPHAVLDVVVDDEIQFLFGKAVVPGKDAIDFVKNELSCLFK